MAPERKRRTRAGRLECALREPHHRLQGGRGEAGDQLPGHRLHLLREGQARRDGQRPSPRAARTWHFARRRQRLDQGRNVISTNQFKNGNHIEVDGVVFKIVEFQHVKPGKGGAFVRTKLRRAADGAVIDRTFRAGEKFRAVRTEARKMTFLYSDGDDAHFMDSQSYEQIAIPQNALADKLRWTRPNEEVDLL